GNTRISFAPNGELFGSQSDKWRRWKLIPSGNATGAVSLVTQRIVSMRTPSIDFTSNTIVITGAGQTEFIPFNDAGVSPHDPVPTTNGINAVSRDGRWLAIHQVMKPLVFVYRLPE